MANPIREPQALRDRALDDLSFIRRTMEGAASFTDVSGRGLIAVALTAFAAAPIAHAQPTAGRWLAVWIAEAVLGAGLSFGMMRHKMRGRQADASMLSVPARKFFLGFWPAVVAAAILTGALVGPGELAAAGHESVRILPGLWLLLYGVGVITAGAFSVRAVPLMGLVFVVLGTAALFAPVPDGDLFLALGFGVVHLAFGVFITRRHGG